MTIIDQLPGVAKARPGAGLGALVTERGNLPLHRLDVRATITGLTAGIELTQGFHNPYDVPIEAVYIFPLPDRAAVTGMRMTVGDRVIEADLKERGAARADYAEAVAAGRLASIAEEDRPDVFTLRVGNIQPGDPVVVSIRLAGPLALADGQAEFRFPLVVAPRYIPGRPLDGVAVGAGRAPDTDRVPDASQITPPVLLPGFPNPIDLSIEVRVDPGGLPLAGVAASLHTITEAGGVLRIQPGERVDRDFILRLSYGRAGAGPIGGHALTLSPDPAGDEGTYELTLLPPVTAVAARPRDVILLLDHSGSMGGWKMVAARRAAARIVDTLTDADRFAVRTFDDEIDRPVGLPAELVAGTDRHRFLAVEHLAATAAAGGTELLAPLHEAIGLLHDTDRDRDRVLVLITDGQVGNEDEILRQTHRGLAGVRVHTVGIDQAVNAGFLRRLAQLGGTQCELVESEDRLDEAMAHIHRRIGAPAATDLVLAPARAAAAAGVGTGGAAGTGTAELCLIEGTASPDRVPDLFPGVPVIVRGRYRGAPSGAITVTGVDRTGENWTVTVPATLIETPALAATWARSRLRDLEDRYVVQGGAELAELILTTSLRFNVLCRFTAYVAVDPNPAAEPATGQPHQIVQPVEQPAGWSPVRYQAAGFGAGSAGSAGHVLARPLAASPAPQAPGSSRIMHRKRQPATVDEPRLAEEASAKPAPSGGQPTPDAYQLTPASGEAALETRLDAAAGPAGPVSDSVVSPDQGAADGALRSDNAVKFRGRPADRALAAHLPGTLRERAAAAAQLLRAATGSPAQTRRDLLRELADRLDEWRGPAGEPTPGIAPAPRVDPAVEGGPGPELRSDSPAEPSTIPGPDSASGAEIEPTQAQAQTLARLARLLRDDAVPLDERWARALAALDGLAAPTQPAGAFWRR